MFNVAPRYLSGVSVFLGDDITKRETSGELVVFIGQATKGPTSAVTLKSIDNLAPLYGTNNPLVKAAHQFWDGYADGGAGTPLQLVAMRVGGVAAKLVTSFGVEIETEDAYDNIEDQFFVYIDDASVDSFNVKVWDKDMLLVFDYLNVIDTSHVKVKVPDLKGTTGKLYGVDVDNDPLKEAVSLQEMKNLDLNAPGGYKFGVSVAPSALIGDTDIVLTDSNTQGAGFDAAADLFPNSGTIRIFGKIGAVTMEEYVDYSAYNAATNTLTLDSAVTVDFTGVAAADMSVTYVGSVLTSGDSQLNLTNRELYEMYRNSLLEVETWTPDYFVPGGAYFDTRNSFLAAKTATTVPTLAQATGPETGTTPLAMSFIEVEAAAAWGDSGYAKVDSGLNVDLGDGAADFAQYIRYSSITSVDDGPTDKDYRLNTSFDQFEVNADYVADSQVLYVSQKTGGPAVTELLPEGAFRILAAGQTKAGLYRIDTITDGVAKLTVYVPADIADPLTGGHVGGAAEFDASGTGALPLTADVFECAYMQFATNDTLVYGHWTETEQYEVGIGYVKETDQGDSYTFEWADNITPGYGLASFSFLFANFCNEATIGYNTPLTAMNMTPPNAFDRGTVVKWIGTKPVYKYVSGEPNAVESVSMSGTGLLGDAVMAGSKDYNRSYMNDAGNNKFVDPAFGLLMSTTNYVDGSEVRDTYGKVVDLGKFMCVGAALLTFKNGASGNPYTETCGIYSLGMLAGSPKSQGISFKKLGQNSSTSVEVIVNRKLYNDLVNLGFIVVTREKGLGWVINNDHSVARRDSGYRLLSTTRIVKTVIEDKRALLASFIGKPINTYHYEAAKTKLSDAFKNDVSKGLLNGYRFNLEASKAGQAIGKLFMRVVINPPLELVQVDIDTVIDRNIQGS